MGYDSLFPIMFFVSQTLGEEVILTRGSSFFFFFFPEGKAHIFLLSLVSRKIQNALKFKIFSFSVLHMNAKPIFLLIYPMHAAFC